MVLECYLCYHLPPCPCLSALKAQRGARWAISKISLCLLDSSSVVQGFMGLCVLYVFLGSIGQKPTCNL